MDLFSLSCAKKDKNYVEASRKKRKWEREKLFFTRGREEKKRGLCNFSFKLIYGSGVLARMFEETEEEGC